MSISSLLRRFGYLGVALVGCVALGCASNTAPPPSAGPSINDQLLGDNENQGRLAAAKSITDAAMRNAALGSVANHAAVVGDVQVVEQALGAIDEKAKKNDATASAALLLFGHGERGQALRLTGQITDAAQRNETLAKMAGDSRGGLFGGGGGGGGGR